MNVKYLLTESDPVLGKHEAVGKSVQSADTSHREDDVIPHC